MNRVYVSVAILILIIVFALFFGLGMHLRLQELITLIQAPNADVSIICECWNDVLIPLEWTVTRAELDAVEEDLARLSQMDAEDPERPFVKARLENELKRIHDGFVPSFAGVF